MTDYAFLLSLRNGRLLPQFRDARDYEATYEVVEAGEPSATAQARRAYLGRIRVGISGSLQAQWGIPDERVGAYLHRLAANYLSHRIRDGDLTEREELQLTTYNAPTDSPISLEDLQELPNPINVLFSRGK
jgi:hypothetical protein